MIEQITIKCSEHGEFLIVADSSSLSEDFVCCPKCWHQDKLIREGK